jgi:hypothetical protein
LVDHALGSARTTVIASELVAELEQIAAQLGVAIRREEIEPGKTSRRPRGGLCRVRGQRVILLDSKLTDTEQVVILAHALAILNLEGVTLKPAVLAALRAHGHADLSGMAPRPLARTRRGDGTR